MTEEHLPLPQFGLLVPLKNGVKEAEAVLQFLKSMQ
jgi:hypothetical protein